MSQWKSQRYSKKVICTLRWSENIRFYIFTSENIKHTVNVSCSRKQHTDPAEDRTRVSRSGASDSGSGDPGSILCRVGVLFPCARDVYSPKVLVIPRNRWLRLNMTEKLFTGTLNHNQNKTKIIYQQYFPVFHYFVYNKSLFFTNLQKGYGP